MSIPTIDISAIFVENAFVAPHPPSLLDLAQLIDEACKVWGFFNIINHGISQELIDRVEAASRVFFASDSSVKKVGHPFSLVKGQACAKKDVRTSRGFLNKEYTKNIVDWKECFDFACWTGEDHEEEGLAGRLHFFYHLRSRDVADAPKFSGNNV
jgi:isopenicillin N synthase-like dioxygenase